MSKWIQIYYSWGDQESPVKVPDGVDPWEYMQQLALKEVAVCQEEYPYGCGIWMYPDDNRIDLKYYQDNEYCHYLITDEEEYDAFYKDEEYVPSSTNGDYSPGNPWDAPGMSIHDFI